MREKSRGPPPQSANIFSIFFSAYSSGLLGTHNVFPARKSRGRKREMPKKKTYNFLMLFYRENIMFQCGAALESFNGIRQLLGDLRRAITTHRKRERSLSWHFGGTGKMRKCFLILYFVRSLLLFFFGFVVRSSNGFFMDREETN